MAKIRHIAYRATDVDAMAKFFVDAMGMKLIQKRKNNAIDLSDGIGEYHRASAAPRARRMARQQAAGHRSHRFFHRQ